MKTWRYLLRDLDRSDFIVNLSCQYFYSNYISRWLPTRGKRDTSGTRMLSKWHTQSNYIIMHAVSEELTIFWKYLPPSLFPALPNMVLWYRCRFGSTYICEKTVSIMNLIKSKYRSILTDHHLKNLLILATSSMNSNIN